jgi:hypothetical protein
VSLRKDLPAAKTPEADDVLGISLQDEKNEKHRQEASGL